MRLSVSSFGRSFLCLYSGAHNASLRRAVRVILAARRRWPRGHLAVSRGDGALHVRWAWGGCTGAMVSLYWRGPLAR